MKYGTASKNTYDQQSFRSPCAFASAQFEQHLCNRKKSSQVYPLRSAGLFVQGGNNSMNLSNANLASTWMGERLTLPGVVYF